MDTRCEFCGKPFTKSRKWSRFCSHRCQRQGYNARRNAAPPTETWDRACAHCSGIFTPDVRRRLIQKFCSPKCARENHGAQRRRFATSAQLKVQGILKAEEIAESLFPEQAAYFAGLLDCEGTIRIYAGPRTNRAGQLRVQIGVTFKPIIADFHRLFGGSMYVQTRQEPRRKDRHTCVLQGWNAFGCLKALHPYLVIKKEHARLGMEFQMTREDLRGYRRQHYPDLWKKRERYVKAFTKLNR